METKSSSPLPQAALVRWSSADAHAYRRKPLRAPHGIHEMDMFGDAALLDLLENYPRERLQAFTMGTDPLDRSAWQPVDTSGASGKDLLAAVTSGRLWYNILQVHLVDGRYRELINRLYG